jgi:hypothetical protein
MQPGRPGITDHRRVYTEAEFALILRKAAELENRGDGPRPASDGMTLADIKTAAAEAGIDPALVERAARLLPARSSASGFERLAGGPLRHRSEVHLPVVLDDPTAARLLAAVQLSAGQSGTGHSSPIGMVWHAQDELEPLSVTARPEGGGTSVDVSLDRRGTMGVMLAAATVGFVAAATAGFALASQVAPELGAAAAVGGMGGALALTRAWWASSTRRARQRIGDVLEAVGKVVGQHGGAP